MIGTLLGIVGSLVGTWLQGRVDVTKAKAEARAANAERREQQRGDWERTMAEGSMTSWKDEFWTVVLAAPFIMAFIPPLRIYALEGFEVIKEMPEWYRYFASIAIAAAFGVRGAISAFRTMRPNGSPPTQ